MVRGDGLPRVPPPVCAGQLVRVIQSSPAKCAPHPGDSRSPVSRLNAPRVPKKPSLQKKKHSTPPFPTPPHTPTHPPTPTHIPTRELQAGCGNSCLTGHGLKFCPFCGRTWSLGFPAKPKKSTIFFSRRLAFSSSNVQPGLCLTSNPPGTHPPRREALALPPPPPLCSPRCCKQIKWVQPRRVGDERGRGGPLIIRHSRHIIPAASGCWTDR